LKAKQNVEYFLIFILGNLWAKTSFQSFLRHLDFLNLESEDYFTAKKDFLCEKFKIKAIKNWKTSQK
jgi:hypothetical protein